MGDSVFPALEKVGRHPVVKWLIRLVVAGVVTFLWPLVTGWIETRASDKKVQEVEKNVSSLLAAHAVDYNRMNRVQDLEELNHAEKLEWVIKSDKLVRQRLIGEMRRRVGLEAMVRQGIDDRRLEAARKLAKDVRIKFDELVNAGEDPTTAADRALDLVYGDR